MGKTFLDIHILELDRYWQIHNLTSEINKLITTLSRFKLTRVVVEATGGYERNLVEALAEAELPVVVVQPTNVRQFAKAQGIFAKTDKIDARLIALFSAVIRPEIREINSKRVRYIRDLLSRKRQLMETRTQVVLPTKSRHLTYAASAAASSKTTGLTPSFAECLLLRL